MAIKSSKGKHISFFSLFNYNNAKKKGKKKSNNSKENSWNGKKVPYPIKGYARFYVPFLPHLLQTP